MTLAGRRLTSASWTVVGAVQRILVYGRIDGEVSVPLRLRYVIYEQLSSLDCSFPTPLRVGYLMDGFFFGFGVPE